jgi:hypothetical protein
MGGSKLYSDRFLYKVLFLTSSIFYIFMDIDKIYKKE